MAVYTSGGGREERTRRRIIWASAVFFCAIVAGVLVGVLRSRASLNLSHHTFSSNVDYVLGDVYDPKDKFFSRFRYKAITDPTNGFVTYVNKSVAESEGITSVADGLAFIRPDATTKLDANGPGRKSVRLVSRAKYLYSMVVLDVAHMPYGCGTWPAFWMLGAEGEWPYAGEIDIVEGVNNHERNSMALHTGSGCTMSSVFRAMSGDAQTNNCYAYDATQPSNAGCAVDYVQEKSYGKGLNDANGGTFVTDIRDEGIRAWFFPHGSEPDDLVDGNPRPQDWGTPDVSFPNTRCSVSKHFKPQNIIINLTFCGDWAGSIFADECLAQTGYSSCASYVAENPSAFSDAYWALRSIKVYNHA